MKDNLNIIYKKMGEINIDDSFFNDLKKDYDNFEKWFLKKKNKYAYCYYEKDNLKALLFLKIENNKKDFINVEPQMTINKKLKISTFKVDAPHKGIGKLFMKIIFDVAIHENVSEVYATILDNDEKKIKLINYFIKYGFTYYGKKNNKELVYIKQINIAKN